MPRCGHGEIGKERTPPGREQKLPEEHEQEHRDRADREGQGKHRRAVKSDVIDQSLGRQRLPDQPPGHPVGEQRIDKKHRNDGKQHHARAAPDALQDPEHHHRPDEGDLPRAIELLAQQPDKIPRRIDQHRQADHRKCEIEKSGSPHDGTGHAIAQERDGQRQTQLERHVLLSQHRKAQPCVDLEVPQDAGDAHHCG